MQRGVDNRRETLRFGCVSADRSSAAEGQPQTIPSSRADPEAHQRIIQLKLLNSSNICYLNSMVMSWLHVSPSTLQGVLPLVQRYRHDACLQADSCAYPNFLEIHPDRME